MRGIMGQKKRRVRFQLKDGPSIEGIMLKRPLHRAGYYVVWGATILKDADESHAVPGDIQIPRENVLFVQDIVQ